MMMIHLKSFIKKPYTKTNQHKQKFKSEKIKLKESENKIIAIILSVINVFRFLIRFLNKKDLQKRCYSQLSNVHSFYILTRICRFQNILHFLFHIGTSKII